MFRFIKPWATSTRARIQPNAFITSSLPMRFKAQRHAGLGPNIQRVRFVKAPVKVRNIAITIVLVSVCFEVYSRLVLDPLVKALDEASKHIPEEEFQEVEEPLFIPFPGTTKQLPAVPYKGTDPEFQEFMKISKDTKLMSKLRVDLVEFMRDLISRTPVVVQMAGKNLKTRRCWLDIDFPSVPPPTFERSGIEISDDAISWVTQPVDAVTVYKIRSVLWPMAPFLTLWTFIKVLAAEEFRSIAGNFGVEFRTSPEQQSLEQLLLRSQKLAKELNGEQKVPGDVQRPLTTKDGLPQQPLGDKSKEIGDTAVPGKPNGKEDVFPTFYDTHKDIRRRIAKPIMAAKLKYIQTTKHLRLSQTQDLYPRGSVKLSGLVEFESEKAFLVFDVYAAWDPKKKEFDVNSMQVILRRMQRKRQRPVNVFPRGPTS